MTTPLHDLLHKDMTRKQFLGVMGVGVATVLGAGNILKLFGKGFEQHGQPTQGTVNVSYGNKTKKA